MPAIEIIKLGQTREREVEYAQGACIRDGDRDVYLHEAMFVPVTECYKTDPRAPHRRDWEITRYHFDRARPVNPPEPPPGPGWFARLWAWITGKDRPALPPARVVER